MKKMLKFLLASLICVCSMALVACDNTQGGTDNKPQGGVTSEEYFLLKDTALSLIIGDEYALVADYYVEADGDVSFRSSNPAVAQVDATGLVTAIGEGETTVTAELGSFSASCVISVSFGEYVPSIQLMAVQGTDVAVASTDLLDLSACVFFNGKQFPCELSYQLSNAEIGQVEYGVFTPLQAGETDVTICGEWNGMELLPITISVRVVNAVEIEIKEKGGEYGVNSIALYTYRQFGGQSLQVSFAVDVLVWKNGEVQTDGISIFVENNDGVVSFEEGENVILALNVGMADLKVCFTDGATVYEKSIPIEVCKPVAKREGTIALDCFKGELPVDEIFAEFPQSDREIVAVSDGFTLTDGKVLGFTVDNEKTQEITVFNRSVGYTLTVIPYTRIFTTADELAMFSMNDLETAYDGYYILGNNIDASSYVHADHIRYAGNSYNLYTNIGLTGTFDGKGYTIDGITIGRSGLFGMVGKGAVIQNVAFTNVKFSGENEGDYTLACYICSATLKNIYIQAKALSVTGWNNALIANNVTVDCVVENCIFRLDDAYTKNAEYGSFTAMTGEREKMDTASSRFLKDCYVISPTVMTHGKAKSVEYVCDVNGAEYVYPNVKRYENMDAFAADQANDYGSFAAEYWNLSSGIPVWKTLPVPTYRVTFDSNGGTAVETQTVNENTAATMPNAPTKEGYTFAGWLLGGAAYDFATPITGDIQLVASWKGKSYTVSFTGAESAVADITATYGEKLTGLPAVPEKVGCSGVWMIGETIVTADTVWLYLENKTLTAVYKTNGYFLFFEGTDESIQPLEITHGETLTMLPTIPAKAGYEGVWMVDGHLLTQESIWEYTESKTATATYTPKTYFVALDANGGTMSDTQVKVTYGESYSIQAPVAADAFASFAGWTYEGKALTSDLWNIDAENIVLKAEWTYALSFENGIPEGFAVTLRNTQVSQSSAQAKDGAYSMLLHTTSSNGYGYVVISKDYLDKVFADPNVISLAMDVYSNMSFADFRYRGFRPAGEANLSYYGTTGLTADTWTTIHYGRTAYEESASLTGTNYLFYYAPGAAGLDLYIDNLRPVMAGEYEIHFTEGGEIVDNESYQVGGKTKLTVSGGVNNLMLYEGESSDGDGKSLRYRFWRRNAGGDLSLPMEMMYAVAGAYSYVAIDVKVSYAVSGAVYFTNVSGTGTYADIKAGEWVTIYCPINHYDLSNMDRAAYLLRLPAYDQNSDFFVFLDNIRFVNEIPS